MTIFKIGERTYEFSHTRDVSICREIHLRHKGDQDTLETKFKDQGVEFKVSNVEIDHRATTDNPNYCVACGTVHYSLLDMPTRTKEQTWTK